MNTWTLEERIAEFHLQAACRVRAVADDLRKKLVELRNACDTLLERIPENESWCTDFPKDFDDYQKLRNLSPGLFAGGFGAVGAKIDTMLIEAGRAGETLQWTAPQQSA